MILTVLFQVSLERISIHLNKWQSSEKVCLMYASLTTNVSLAYDALEGQVKYVFL